MSAVFTIGETDFDDLDDEEFLSEVCNFESNQLTTSISCNNLQKGSLTNNIGDNGSAKNSNGCGSKKNLLRSKGASVNQISNSIGNLRPSLANCKAPNNELVSTNAKRTGHSSDKFSSEPPLKKPNFVKENRIPSLENDRSFYSPRFSRNNASDQATGALKMSKKPNMSTNDRGNNAVDFNSGVNCRPMSNLSNGLRYTQNTTSVVSSPILTNDEPRSLTGASRHGLRSSASCDHRRTPEINSIPSNTPNRYAQRNSSPNLLRNTMSPSVNRQTSEFRRLSKESSDHLTETSESELQTDSSYTHQTSRTHANSIPPITPNRYTTRDASQSLLRNTMSPSVNRQTPEFRRLSKESTDHLKGTSESELQTDSSYTHQKPRTDANSFPPITPNRYTTRDASQSLLRNTMSPSVNRQTSEFRRLSKESTDHLKGTSESELQTDSSYTHQKPRTDANSFPPITPNRYTTRDTSQSLLRNTMSPSVSRQIPEFRRFSRESSDHLTGTGECEFQTDSLYTHQKKKDGNYIPPITKIHTPRDSSLDKLRSSLSPAVNTHTPTFRGFAKESPANRRTPTTDVKCVTPKTRRFPGPAGILPRLVPGENLDNLPSPLAETPKKISPTASQLVDGDNDADFSMEPWTLMQDKIGKEFPHSLDSLASVVRKAASHQLERGKVAFLAVLVKSFHVTGLDVSIVLKDPSGEMRGTLHRKVFEEQQVELGPGCGFFLKQVSVFSPSPRKHYLNITPGNILEIFPASAERCSSQKEISEATPKRGSNETEKQTMCSNPTREIDQAQTSEETNFDQLLEGMDEDDDDMLVEAIMNF